MVARVFSPDAVERIPNLPGALVSLAIADKEAVLAGLRIASANGSVSAVFWLANLLTRVESAASAQSFMLERFLRSGVPARARYAPQLARIACLAANQQSAEAFKHARSALRNEAQDALYSIIASSRIPDCCIDETACVQTVMKEAQAFREGAHPVLAQADVAWEAFFSRVLGSRSVALVGNGGSLRGANRGAEIDSHDTVVRVNFPSLNGYEEDAGSRCDLMLFVETALLAAGRPGGIPFNRYLSRADSYSCSAFMSIPEQHTFSEVDPAATLAQCGIDKYVRFSLETRRFLQNTSYISPTSGLLAALILTLLLRARVSMFGFDFYEVDFHFWTDGVGFPGLHHEPAFEKLLVQHFLTKYLAVSHI
jgi:hypothetical protein